MSSIGNNTTSFKGQVSAKFWRKTLTAATTTLSGPDDVGLILDYAQGTELVVRNGVVLTPTVHYTIASATSITLVNSAAIGDEIIIIGQQPVEFVDTYRKSETDSLLDQKASLSGGIFSGPIYIHDGSTISGSPTVTGRFQRTDGTYNPRIEFRHSTIGSDINTTYTTGATNLTFSIAGTERMRIDAGGRVTMPYQPAFSAINGPQVLGGSQTTLAFTTAVTNIGGHYSTSTYRFTAPVNGVYRFSFSLMTYQNYWSRCQFSKSGTMVGSVFYAGSASSSYNRNNGEITLELVAGDWVSVQRNISNEAGEMVHPDYRHFSGELIS